MASPPSLYVPSAPYAEYLPSPSVESAPAPSPSEIQLDWGDIFTSLGNWLTLLCYGFFILLIGWDVWRAIRKRATWLPGKAFSLTGVTVQIIVWWTSVSRITNESKKDVDVIDLAVLHQIVLSGKVALCVFIGYLLPGMTAPSVRTFLALGITVCAQVASELRLFQTQEKYIEMHAEFYSVKFNTSWMKIANSILFICIVVLGLISVCAILASQTVHGLLRQRTYAIFSITNEDKLHLLNERTITISWSEFDDEVLSSWLIARVCRADYVISRSVFSSAIGIVVTFCVLIFLSSNTIHNIYFFKPYYPLDYAILSLLSSFIIIGWIVICWRWLAAQLFFRSHGRSWRRCLCPEDFWTRNTVELIRMYDLKKHRQRIPKMERLLIMIFTKLRLHKLIYLLFMLQLIVVFLGKLCGLLSEVLIGQFMYCLRKNMRKGHPKCQRILKLLCMPGEDSTDLWEANEMSFNKGKDLMQKGCKKGRSNKEINSILSLYSMQWAEKGKQLLSMLQTRALPSVSKHFPSVEKQYVRITIVSLLTIFIRLQKAKSAPLEKVLEACHQVWDLLSFADDYDIDLQANAINLYDDLNKDKDQVCMAAEREFYKLQKEYHKLSSGCEGSIIDVAGACRILEALSNDCEDLLKRKNLLGGGEEVAANLSDSKDWTEIAPKYNLYKLCRLMLDEVPEDVMEWTEQSLRNVIAFCLSRLPDMLLKQCREWAQEFEEDKLWEAIDLAGKCRGMMEAWELNPTVTRNTTKQWTSDDMQSV